MHYKLTLVTHRQNVPLDQYLAFIERCAIAGINAVQLREKNAPYEFLLEFGIKLQAILTPLQIPLIINDHMQLAYDLNADGVHMGQSDGDPQSARALLGPDKIIGVSVNTLADVMAANDLPIDYVGAGSVYPTTSKTDVLHILGAAGLNALVAASKHQVIAIGGINLENAADTIATGIQGIAVIGAIHQAENPAAIIKNFLNIIEELC